MSVRSMMSLATYEQPEINSVKDELEYILKKIPAVGGKVAQLLNE